MDSISTEFFRRQKLGHYTTKGAYKDWGNPIIKEIIDLFYGAGYKLWTTANAVQTIERYAVKGDRAINIATLIHYCVYDPMKGPKGYPGSELLPDHLQKNFCK